MAKVPAFTVAIVAVFSGLLFFAYVPGFITSKQTLETLSHISGVLGLVAIAVTSVLAYRKKLLNAGFENFQKIYSLEMQAHKENIHSEMIDFKKEIRTYINQAEERHSKTLDQIAGLYVKTHEEIISQNRQCDLIQSTKPLLEEQERKWKNKVETELDEIRDKLSHIEDCVNNKKK